MIVDWKKTCESIYKNKELLSSDPTDNKHKTKQEIMYLKYLKEIIGLNKENIFQEWKKIKNGLAFKFSDDEIDQKCQFLKLYASLQKKTFKTVLSFKEIEPVTIYEDEIEYLNNLQVPLWAKQYWLCLLFYYKFESQVSKVVYKSPSLNSWSMNNTEVSGRNYGAYQMKLAEYRAKTGKNIIQMYTPGRLDKYPSYVPSFIKFAGKPAYIAHDIDEIQQVIKLLKDFPRYCNICGKTFFASSKCQRECCDECYVALRKSKIAKNAREYKRKQKVIQQS